MNTDRGPYDGKVQIRQGGPYGKLATVDSWNIKLGDTICDREGRPLRQGTRFNKSK